MPKTATPLLALAGVLVGAGTARHGDAPAPAPAPAAVAVRPAPPSPEALTAAHLARASEAAEAAVDRSLAPLGAFFRDAHGRAPAFADWATGWGSKRRLLQDKLSWGRRDRHPAFLRDKFEQTVLAPADLERAVREAVAAFEQDERALEIELLLAVRADVSLHPADYTLGTADAAELARRYDAIAATLAASAAGPVGGELAARDGGSLVAGEALTLAVARGVAARMGGRLAARGALVAAGGAATLGVGIVVGVAVDQLVGHVWDRVADPKGKLAGEVVARLEELQRDTVGGVRDELLRRAKARAELRGRAVAELVRASAVSPRHAEVGPASRRSS